MSTKQDARRTCWRLNEEKWEQLGWSSEEVEGRRGGSKRERECGGGGEKKGPQQSVYLCVCMTFLGGQRRTHTAVGDWRRLAESTAAQQTERLKQEEEGRG